MTLKIFHTGDIHIGMKFSSYGDAKENLVEARFSALENMINKSNDLNADIFVVAGDLFNNIKVAQRDIARTVRILDKFNGACVLVLPGNHDYYDGINELWQDFARTPSDKILLLNDERPYFLDEYDLAAVIYPAPCDRKHSSENCLGWIRKNGRQEEGKYHIGIAHGALEGLSPDMEGNYYYMSMEELNSLPMDLWLIGHTHVSYPFKDEISNHRIYNAGTPEPDGLDFKSDGAAWFIILEDDKISAERIVTGNYRFYDMEYEIKSDEDLEDILAWVREDEPNKKIVRLTLKGNLSKEAYDDLSSFYRQLESQVLHLLIEDTNLRPRISKEIIEKEFTKGSFPYEFLNELAHDEEALQIAYDLIRRS